MGLEEGDYDEDEIESMLYMNEHYSRADGQLVNNQFKNVFDDNNLL